MSAITAVKKTSRGKDSRRSAAPKTSEIVAIIRALQKQNKTKPRAPKRGDRIGFSFSSKDRYFFTLQALESLDSESGFDLIWNDGSQEAAVPALAANYKFRNARLVEINRGVTGGAERAVCFGLSRLLELGYDYVGLIENDILFCPGWFGRLMEVFSLGAAEGIACGSATARSFESHVLEYRNGYAVQADIGAGMVLFSRAAAEIIMELYANPSSLQMTTHSWQKFHADLFGLDLRNFAPFWAYPPAQAFPCTLDWGYTPSLYLNGYASLSTIPSYATDLEFDVEKFFHTRYVSGEKNNTGVSYPRVAAVARATTDERALRRHASLKG